MNFFRIVWLFVVFPLFASGQFFEHYKSIESSGIIPADFLTKSSEKFKTAKDDLKGSEHAKSKKAAEDFLLESNFLINQVLNSGRILFNDSATIYLNEILDVILVNEPILRSQLRVYSVKSTSVNSFTTNDGIILVNLGLIAQLENEAQLAFILCHEIAHYTEKHVINAYIQREELKNGEKLKRASFDEKLLEQSQYSKDLEKEADRLGIKRFLKTPYSTSSIRNVFEVMRYAHLPFDDIPFDQAFFNHAHYKIHESFYLNNVRTVEPMDPGQPKDGTHPSPTERLQLLMTYLAMEDKTDGQDYVLGKPRFEQIRNVCRFELSELYLNANSPVKSIYNAFLLQKDFPKNEYLQKIVAKALYRLSKFKSGGNYGFVHPGFSHIEGESQQLFHLFYQLKPEELCILATGHIWRLREAYPDDLDLQVMSDDLLQNLMEQFYVPGMFSETEPPEEWNLPNTSSAESKYDRLRQKAKDNPRLGMVKYALVDVFKNQQFKSQFDSLEQKFWGPEREVEPVSSTTNSSLRQWKNHGFSVGAEKVVVVSPTYAKLDLRKKQQHKFLHSESAKTNFLTQIKRSSNILSLETAILDQEKLDSSNVEAFNDIAFLNQWVDGRFTDLDVSMVNLPTEKVNSLVKKYGTEYFAWTGIINYRESKPLMYFYLLYALIPPAIPFAVYYLVRPNFDTYYYCIVFNIRTGEPVLVNYANYRKRDARDMINSSIYDSFWQIKRKAKE